MGKKLASSSRKGLPKRKIKARDRAAAERLTLMSQAISGIMYDWNAKLGTVKRSSGLYELLGFKPSDVTSDLKWWEERIHPDDLDKVQAAFSGPNNLVKVEYRIRHKSGRYVNIWDQALIIRGKRGKIERVVGSNLDVSKHKEIEGVLKKSYRAEKKARETAERVLLRVAKLQRITNSFSNAMTSAEVANTILPELLISLEATSGALFIIAADQTQLCLLSSLAADGGAVEVPQMIPIGANLPLGKALKSGSVVVANSKTLLTKTYPKYSTFFGNGWKAGMIAYPLTVNNHNLGVVVIGFENEFSINPAERDFARTITQHCGQALERAELFESEKLAREQAERANRAKDEFFAMVSHELRSPLQSILGWIRLARSSKLDAETSARALDVMERNTRAQVQLVSDLLEASRIITGKIAMASDPIEVGVVLEGSVESIRPTATNKGIDLKVDIEANLPVVWGDSNRLQQVFWNLLSNAIKFTPPGGSVTASASAKENFVIITVQDTGQGMTKEFLPFVFDRFSQADVDNIKIHGGLGLGLSIVKHLVELHGGEISVDSPGLDKGSTFTAKLPRRPAAMLEAKPSALPLKIDNAQVAIKGENDRNIFPLHHLKVLVIEDGADTLDFILTVLKSAGADVCGVESVKEGLEKLKSFNPDILLSDIGLPTEDGYSLITKTRLKFTPEQLPAIALTAFARPEDREKVRESGFQLHLSKPVDPDVLVEAIRSIAGKKVIN